MSYCLHHLPIADYQFSTYYCEYRETVNQRLMTMINSSLAALAARYKNHNVCSLKLLHKRHPWKHRICVYILREGSIRKLDSFPLNLTDSNLW